MQETAHSGVEVDAREDQEHAQLQPVAQTAAHAAKIDQLEEEDQAHGRHLCLNDRFKEKEVLWLN